MPKFIVAFVRFVDAANRLLGHFAMYLIFAMAAVLLYASLSRTIFDAPVIWSVETAQMLMAAYYLLGGGYSLQLDSHVRMDLLYGRWRPHTRAVVDYLTALFALFYLAVLLYGAVSSTHYAIEYNQKNYSVWAPPMAPVKMVMTFGIGAMLLQITSVFFKDLAAALGKPIAAGAAK